MFSRTIALNNGHSSPSGLRFRPLLLLSWSVLLLSLTISTEASGQSSSCQSGFRLEQQRLRVILEPFRHRMKVRVEVQVHKMNKQPRWFFRLSPIARLSRVQWRSRRRWRSLPFLRHHNLFSIPALSATRGRLRFVYELRFSGKGRYLTRLSRLRIESEETYAFHDWTPLPLLCSLPKTPLVSSQMWVKAPASLRVVGPGRLVTSKLIGKQRWWRWDFAFSSQQSPPLLAAALRLFRVTQKSRFSFYFRAGFQRSRLRRLHKWLTKGWTTLRQQWGPRFPTQQSRPQTDTLRLVSYGGARLQIYPGLVLLPQRLGFPNAPLRGWLNSLMTQRQFWLYVLAQQWWGQSIRGVGQGRVWLNQGLAHYAAIQALRKLRGPWSERRALQRCLRSFLKSATPGHLRFVSPDQQGALSTAQTRGVLVLYELHRRLSRKTVLEGLKLLFRTYRGQSFESKDLRRQWEHLGGRELQLFFLQWIWGEDLPSSKVLSWSCKRRAKGCLLKVALQNRGSLTAWWPLEVRGASGQKLRFLLKLPPQRTLQWQQWLTFRPWSVKAAARDVLLQGIRWKRWLQQAHRLRQQQLWKESQLVYQQLLQWNPRHPQALYGLARWHQQQRQLGEAAILYQQLLRPASRRLRPRWPSLWARVRLAEIALQQKKPTKARRWLSRLRKQKQNPFGLQKEVQRLWSTLKTSKTTR